MRSLVVAVVACVTLVACGGAEDSGSGLRGGLTGNEGDDVEQPSDDAGTGEADASEPAQGDAAVVVEQDAGSAPVVVDAGAVEQDAGSGPVVVDAGTDAAVVNVPQQPQVPACSVQWYRDADGDGFGAGAPLISCSQPTGYVLNSDDCYDGNKDARPGQEGRFGEHRGDGSFDYDCDGAEVKQNNKLATCPVMTAEDNSCPPPNVPAAWDDQPRSCYEELRARFDAVRDGWWETTVPACGELGRWDLLMTYTRRDGYTCNPPYAHSLQRQACR